MGIVSKVKPRQKKGWASSGRGKKKTDVATNLWGKEGGLSIVKQLGTKGRELSLVGFRWFTRRGLYEYYLFPENLQVRRA